MSYIVFNAFDIQTRPGYVHRSRSDTTMTTEASRNVDELRGAEAGRRHRRVTKKVSVLFRLRSFPPLAVSHALVHVPVTHKLSGRSVCKLRECVYFKAPV